MWRAALAYFLQQAINGLTSATLYALLAYGYALVFGVTHRASFVQGALFAFGGQLVILGAVFAYQQFLLDFTLAVVFGALFSLCMSLLVADLLARRVIIPLVTRSPNTFIAATLGVMIALMELGRIAADTRDWWLPPLSAHPFVLWEKAGFTVSQTPMQIASIVVGVTALVLAQFAFQRSQAGRLWRAVSDDPLAAALTGVDAFRVMVRSVIAGTALAFLAGLLAALHFGNISFGTGLTFGLKVIFVASLGGRQPITAAAGAAAVGLAETQWEAWFAADWRDAVILGGLCLLLVLSPSRRDEQ
jgi:branched-chain amino acid transport system permease protein